MLAMKNLCALRHCGPGFAMLHCGYVMRRIPSLTITVVVVFSALTAIRVLATGPHTEQSIKASPTQLIEKARDVASLNAVGPVEIQADLRATLSNGRVAKGTYTLYWAAPDRFREEIHLPGYDEIKLAIGTTLYRKRNTDFTPLTIFRVEELMDPSAVVAQVVRGAAHPILVDTDTAKSSHSQLPSELKGLEITETSGKKIMRISIPAASYEEISINTEHGWPIEIARRVSADDEILKYADYKPLGSGFVPLKRQYLSDGIPVVEAHIKSVASMTSFPSGTFDVPTEVEKLDWCSNEIPAERLPLKEPLPVTMQDFSIPEITDAFVNADGTVRRMQIIGSGGPTSDAAIQKIANLIHFTPAMCGGKPVASEAPFVIGVLDLGMAVAQDEKDIHFADRDGFTEPGCLHCPDPDYSDEAFHAKIQGEVVLSVVIMPDGEAHDIHVLKRLGHGLDEQAVKAAIGWRFKPALGPDGKPAAVRMLIDISFHLY